MTFVSRLVTLPVLPPSFTVTVTIWGPAAVCWGVCVVIEPALSTEKLFAGVAPNVTATAPMKLDPEMVTGVPPRILPVLPVEEMVPVLGVMPVTCGAPGDRYRYWLDPEVLPATVTVTPTAPGPSPAWLQSGVIRVMLALCPAATATFEGVADPFPKQGKLTVVTGVPLCQLPGLKLVPVMLTDVAIVVSPTLGPTPLIEGPPAV